MVDAIENDHVVDALSVQKSDDKHQSLMSRSSVFLNICFLVLRAVNVPVVALFQLNGFLTPPSRSVAMTGDQEQLDCLQGCCH